MGWAQVTVVKLPSGTWYVFVQLIKVHIDKVTCVVYNDTILLLVRGRRLRWEISEEFKFSNGCQFFF